MTHASAMLHTSRRGDVNVICSHPELLRDMVGGALYPQSLSLALLVSASGSTPYNRKMMAPSEDCVVCVCI